MKSDFLLAITQLAAEKNLPREVVLQAVEAALASAYKKDSSSGHQDISVKIHPATGEVKVYTLKTVVEEPADSQKEISLSDAQRIRKTAQLGETIAVETASLHGGRIVAQTAKQVVLQRLREAEREIVFEEYAGKEGDIISGVVQRIELKQITVDLGKAEAMLPPAEQVRTERYRVGQRLKVLLLEVFRGNKGPQLAVSRSHPNLVRRLFEMEVPEVYNGTVEIKAIAREAGYRSKVAVAARQQNIDPVGSCVGLRGVRIQNIVNELNGEKIDIIQWHADLRVLIANALSPAQVLSVNIDEGEKTAAVVVPDRQLSLAIGKEGQNARLAAKLTGWRVDIKSATAAEAEKAALAEVAAEELAPAEEGPAPLEEVVEEAPIAPEETVTPVEVEPVAPPQIRFAEELAVPQAVKPDTRPKRGKKKHAEADKLEDRVKPVKVRKRQVPSVEEEDYEEDL